jgi:hypothetical protein
VTVHTATLLASALITLAGSGCSDDLARQSLVTGLRLFAVSAEPPEVAPSDRVVVTALWHSPDAQPPTFRWSHCPAPADGAIDRCDGLETELPSGDGVDEASFLAPGDTSVELVRLAVDALGDSVTAGKRVAIGGGDSPNTNPVVDALTVTFDDGPDGDQARMVLEASPGSVEQTPEGTLEGLFVSWFATAGTFDDDRSFGPAPTRFEVLWTPPAEPEDVRLWAVLRDGRGGVGWAEQVVSLR